MESKVMAALKAEKKMYEGLVQEHLKDATDTLESLKKYPSSSDATMLAETAARMASLMRVIMETDMLITTFGLAEEE